MPLKSSKDNRIPDTLGRLNRKLRDKQCDYCGETFRPRSAKSKYCSRPCMWINNGKNQEKVRECWFISQKGYMQGFVWENGEKRMMKQHRYIMEQYLGRRLQKGEVVHHCNGNRLDNRIENLQLMKNGEHTAYHKALKGSGI